MDWIGLDWHGYCRALQAGPGAAAITTAGVEPVRRMVLDVFILAIRTAKLLSVG